MSEKCGKPRKMLVLHNARETLTDCLIGGYALVHDDTVYPRAITMDPPSPPQVPQGPMTRARARAFETEVTSLLALLPYESCETWLLPQASVLCVLRCEGDHFGEELEDGQVPKVMDELMQQEDQKAAP